MHWSLGEFGKEILIADIDELENLDASEIYPRRPNAKEVLKTQKNVEFVIPVADGSAKLWSRYHEFLAIVLAETLMAKRKSLNLQNKKMKRKLEKISGLFSEIPSTVITLNREFNSRAKRRNIPYSTEIHWCHKIDLYWFLHCTGKTKWWLLDCWWKQKFVKSVDRIHEVYTIKWFTSKRIHVVRVRLTKIQTTSRPDQIWPEAWTRIGKAAQRRTRMGTRKDKTRAWQKFEGNLLYWSKWRGLQRRHQECETEVRNTHGSCHAM